MADLKTNHGNIEGSWLQMLHGLAMLHLEVELAMQRSKWSTKTLLHVHILILGVYLFISNSYLSQPYIHNFCSGRIVRHESSPSRSLGVTSSKVSPFFLEFERSSVAVPNSRTISSFKFRSQTVFVLNIVTDFKFGITLQLNIFFTLLITNFRIKVNVVSFFRLIIQVLTDVSGQRLLHTWRHAGKQYASQTPVTDYGKVYSKKPYLANKQIPNSQCTSTHYQSPVLMQCL